MRTYQTLLNLNVDHWDMLAGEHVPTEFDCGNYDLEAVAEMLVPSDEIALTDSDVYINYQK
jgi:hypothetical protein